MSRALRSMGHFPDVLPDSLRFLVQWISNDVARVLMVLGFSLHLVLVVYSGKMRVFVRRARAQKATSETIESM